MSKSEQAASPEGEPRTPPLGRPESGNAGRSSEEPPASSPASNWRFRSRRDVCRGLESIAQLSLMGGLSPAQVKDLSGILRAIGALLPKDETAGGEAIPESLREVVNENPQLLASLQHLLTEEQLRQLLQQQGDPPAGPNRR